MVPIAALVTISRVALLLVAAAIATAIIGMLHVSSGWKASIDSVDLWAPWSDVDTSSEGGCVVMMLLLLGGSFGASQLVLQTNRLKATGRSAAVRAPRARAHGSKRISVRLLDGSLRFMEWLQDDFVLRKRARAAHRLALWPVIAAARAADRAAGLAMFLGSTMRGWAEGLMKWRRREYNRHWQTLTLGTKLFYLCVALVINAVPTPESSTTITSQLTPSQFSISPFMTAASHAAHLLAHQQQQFQYKLISFGPEGFDAALASAVPSIQQSIFSESYVDNYEGAPTTHSVPPLSP
jgi:hypothetical protein